MSTVNNMQIQDDEGNVFHPETSIEQIVGENGTQVFPGGKPGHMASSDMTTAFTESKMRENIKSGEKHRVLFGKIQKFFTDLKTVAFSGKYGDLSERPTLGGAAGYKVADNDTTNSSEFLSTARVAYEHGQEIDALSRDLGGCSLEQENGNFYIVGADSVRKKLAESPEYSSLDCGNVDFKEHEFGQWHHGYHFTKVSEIPNFGSMVHGKDFFIEVYNGGTNQENVGIGVSYVKHSNSELVMTSVNGLKSLNVKVYYISNRAIPSPSSFLKSVDFTIASGTATKNILLSDITDAGEIVCAGLVSRGWEGWNALNVTYTTESVTITFSTSNNSGNAYGSEIVRVWYR